MPSVTVGKSIAFEFTEADEYGYLIEPDVAPTYTVTNPENLTTSPKTALLQESGYYLGSFDIPVNGTPSDNWKIVWKYFVNQVEYSASYNFTVTLPEDDATVNVDSNSLDRIMGVLGHPLIDYVVLKKPDIKKYCIMPALELYFSKFPIEEKVQLGIAGELVLDFPDNWTIGVVDCRVVNKTGGDSSNNNNNFLQILAFQGRGGGVGSPWKRKNYGTKFNFNGLNQTFSKQMMLADTIGNNLNTFKYYPDYANRQLRVYSSLNAMLAVTWGKYSYDFNKVRFTHKNDVITLAQSFLLNHLARTGNIWIDENIPVKINSGELKTDGDALYNSIVEKWATYPNVISIPMS